ncbi:MAG: hypothetical protein HY660_03490 [Armatimonadetes bacterium]|nr:hypothetical protein [Armatimonadota bacterium]
MSSVATAHARVHDQRMWLKPTLRLGETLARPPAPLEDLWPPGTRVAGLFSMGRDALWQMAAAKFSPAEFSVWLPAYSCTQLIDAFRRTRVPMRFYDVRPDLTVDWEAVIEARRRHAGRHALVVVDYFGFAQPFSLDLHEAMREYFDVVIRDCAHSLPHPAVGVIPGRECGYILYSLRKLAPIPDLAPVLTAKDSASSADIAPPAGRPFARTVYIGLESAELMIEGLRGMASLQRRLRRLKEDGQWGSPVSRLSLALARRVDFSRVREARRANAIRLAQGLAPWARCHHAPEAACPYYFPLRVNDPARVKDALARVGIETTTFWRSQEAVTGPGFPVARETARSTLCLPVHQDLTPGQVDRLIQAVSAVVEPAAA